MGDSGRITRSKNADFIATAHQPVQEDFHPAHKSSIGSDGDNPFLKSGLILCSPPHSVGLIKVTFKKMAKKPKETVEIAVIAKTPREEVKNQFEVKKQNNIREEIPQEELLSILPTMEDQYPVKSNTTIAEAKIETGTPAVPEFVALLQFNTHKGNKASTFLRAYQRATTTNAWTEFMVQPSHRRTSE
ncbi:hypothetical protein JTB14_017945 [Gonioctena quinquepunctata]|nr:hypothetical protein JTB14_017945 [Gonioctena quinquepunctata]